MPSPIYKTYSFSQFLFTVIVRMGAFPLGIYLYTHYDDNPNLITVAMIICVLIFLSISYEQITIDADSIIQKDISIMEWLFRSKGKQYSMNEIKRAFIPPVVKPNVSEIGVAFILMAIIPGAGARKTTGNSLHAISLELKNGQVIPFFTDMSESKRMEIVNAINSMK